MRHYHFRSNRGIVTIDTVPFINLNLKYQWINTKDYFLAFISEGKILQRSLSNGIDFLPTAFKPNIYELLGIIKFETELDEELSLLERLIEN